MTDARLYALIVWLRSHGVDVCLGLTHGDWFGWCENYDTESRLLPQRAHAAIVVWCMGAMTRARWLAASGNFSLAMSPGRADEYRFPGKPHEPHGWLLAVAHARGLAVPAEMTKEVES